MEPAPTRAPSGTLPCPRPPSHHTMIHNSDDQGLLISVNDLGQAFLFSHQPLYDGPVRSQRRDPSVWADVCAARNRKPPARLAALLGDRVAHRGDRPANRDRTAWSRRWRGDHAPRLCRVGLRIIPQSSEGSGWTDATASANRRAGKVSNSALRSQIIARIYLSVRNPNSTSCRNFRIAFEG